MASVGTSSPHLLEVDKERFRREIAKAIRLHDPRSSIVPSLGRLRQKGPRGPPRPDTEFSLSLSMLVTPQVRVLFSSGRGLGSVQEGLGRVKGPLVGSESD